MNTRLVRRQARVGAVQSARQFTQIGANIERERALRGLSLDELAADAGIGRNTLWRMCHTGSPSPSVDTVQKVADALAIPLWEIFKPQDTR